MNEKSLFPLALYLAQERREHEIRAVAEERSVKRQPVHPTVGRAIARPVRRVAGR